MDDVIATLEGLLAGLSDESRQEVVRVAMPKLDLPWLPNPGAQTDAYLSQADQLLYGGQAGGGKSSLLLGVAANDHDRSLILRREAVELDGLISDSRQLLGARDKWSFNGSDNEWNMDFKRSIRFGSMKEEDDWRKHAGRARDFYGFDEAAEFTKSQVSSLIAWLRAPHVAGQAPRRCRVVFASNPPRSSDGQWVIEWFAPWLDPLFPNPAEPGELRWCIMVGGKTRWVDGPQTVVIDGEEYTPFTRTFIRASVDDNPFLARTTYKQRLQNIASPVLRRQLLKGDFLAGREDHEWQVIPSSWVSDAQQRWQDAPKHRRMMLAFATDVALGGGDEIVGSALHEDNWFAPLETMARETDEPFEIASWIVRHQRDEADLSVDATGGWGSGVRSHLNVHHKIDCYPVVFSAKSNFRSKDGRHTFLNKRAELWWRFFEALSPDSGEDIMLPPDPRLAAQLAAPRYLIRTGSVIVIESKEEVRKRLGSSTDRADAVIMAWSRRTAILRKSRTVVPGLPSVKPQFQVPINSRDGWMMNG